MKDFYSWFVCLVYLNPVSVQFIVHSRLVTFCILFLFCFINTKKKKLLRLYPALFFFFFCNHMVTEERTDKMDLAAARILLLSAGPVLSPWIEPVSLRSTELLMSVMFPPWLPLPPPLPVPCRPREPFLRRLPLPRRPRRAILDKSVCLVLARKPVC